MFIADNLTLKFPIYTLRSSFSSVSLSKGSVVFIKHESEFWFG